MLYHIIRITTRYAGGMRITHEKTVKLNATLDEVIALAKRHGEDIDEVLHDLEDLGCVNIKGYSIYER